MHILGLGTISAMHILVLCTISTMYKFRCMYIVHNIYNVQVYVYVQYLQCTCLGLCAISTVYIFRFMYKSTIVHV